MTSHNHFVIGGDLKLLMLKTFIIIHGQENIECFVTIVQQQLYGSG
ncbi:MAG: hypothetical protein ACFFDN_02000 [Candidatus Hodarchaeota archaeon]